MSTTYGGANTYPANITLPSDGDVKNAASVNVPLEGLADRTAYLYARSGAYRVVSVSEYAHTSLNDVPALSDTIESFTTGSYVAASNALVSIAGALVYDVLLVDVALTALVTDAALGAVRAEISENGGSFVAMPGMRKYIQGPPIGSSVGVAWVSPVQLSGKIVIGVAGTSIVKLYGRYDTPTGGGTPTLKLILDASLRVVHLRRN